MAILRNPTSGKGKAKIRTRQTARATPIITPRKGRIAILQNQTMILIVTTKATNSPKSTLNLMTLSVSTVARRGTKPLIVGSRKGLRNYNKNANLIETEI